MKFLLISLLVCIIYADPSPPYWGGNPQFNVWVNLTNPSPVAIWQMHYYYDSLLNASRYEHYQPQYDEMCLLASPPDSIAKNNCTVVFAADGWSYIDYWSDNWCCKCENAFGSVKYDWLQKNSTYEGQATVNGYQTYHWLKYGSYDNHYYCTTDGQELPVKYWENWGSEGKLKAWNFMLSTYQKGAFNQSLVEPPANCQNLCKGNCWHFRVNATQAQ